VSTVVERVVASLRADPGAPVPPRHRLAALVRASDPLLGASQVERAVEAIEADLAGLGVLQPLLDADDVSDVLVNGPGPVWVERRGRLEQTDVRVDRAQVLHLVERIVTPAGRRADPVHALVDARLPDGSRAHVVMPPLAVDGPVITIRRFSVRPVPLDRFGEAPVVALLREAVRSRCNVVVSGATGSGKTTLLNALAAHIDASERVVTVEDAAELRLAAPHVVRLEARPATADAPGVDVRELVRNALRMRPDRIVVGEVRSGESFDLIGAMSTGHDGSLATVHANGAADALHRLQTLALLGGTALPHEAIARLLAAAVDLVVHVARGPDGRRSVVEVVEVVGVADASVATRRLFDGRRPTRQRVRDRSGLEAMVVS
jgi:pilus assembly protein CpaF